MAAVTDLWSCETDPDHCDYDYGCCNGGTPDMPCDCEGVRICYTHADERKDDL